VLALVMELVEGPTLAERIACGPLPLDEALSAARQIAEALEAAHERGIVHRDLKPANVKITPHGVVKVLDFGLAKATEPPTASSDPANSPTVTISITQVGTIMGTAAYMAPEQARGKPVDRRADIWAFGVVLYEMLTGRELYAGETVTDTLAAVVTREPDWTKLPANTPPRIRRLLERCLRKDVKTRLQAIAEARIAIDEPEDKPAPPIIKTSRRASWMPRVWMGFGILVAIWALFPRRAHEPAPAVVRFLVNPPDKMTFYPSGPALSPDGRHLAAVVFGPDGVRQLWVRDMDSLAGRLLPGTALSGNPFWSPDGRSLGFFAGGKLKRIDIFGGSPQTLCDAPLPMGGSWNQDGVIVFTPNIRDSLYRVPAAGGAPARVTDLDTSSPEPTDRWPWFLPDGRHFLFLFRSSQTEKSGIYVASLDSKDRKRLLSAVSSPAYAPSADPARGHILFRRDTALMAQPFNARQLELTGDPFPIAERVTHIGNLSRTAFSVSAKGALVFLSGDEFQGNMDLVWFDRYGKPLGPAAGLGRGAFNHFRLSPDQKRIAVSRADLQRGNSDIWLLEFARGVPSRFTFDPALKDFPLWSPDGSRVAWVGGVPGTRQIFQKTASGDGQDELLVKSARGMNVGDWSPDGRYLVYSAADGQSGYRDVWAAPLEGDRKPVRIIQSNFNKDQVQFSPDGRWLAYTSNESGNSQVFVQRFQPGGPGVDSGSGGKWQISTAGGSQPRWRRDGKELFCLASDRKLVAVPVQTGASFEAGVLSALFQVPAVPTTSEFAYQYDVTADGKRFLVKTLSSGDVTSQPLTVVLNWAAELKK
jgi:Tol biopolymer transport system component